MRILTTPLTDSYFIVFFQAYSAFAEYSISKEGYVLHSKNAIETEFTNNNLKYYTHRIVRLSAITEELAAKIFNDAGVDGKSVPYINYTDRGIIAKSALESFDSYIDAYWQGQDLALTWVIFPKPNKELKGKKFVNEFNVGALDFGHGNVNMDLDVYITQLTKTSKSISFSVRIPKFLYDKCMTDSIIENRPQRNYIESNTLADLHEKISSLVSQAHNLEQNEKEAKNAKKVICIYFSSKEEITRDSWNHGYTGQQIATVFRFFVCYKTGNSFGKTSYFTYKKYQTGQGSTERGIKGIIDTELSYGRNYIANVPSVIITWTQEREDFLIGLEERFRSLSENLNKFLSSLDEDKLQALIENANLLKIGNN